MGLLDAASGFFGAKNTASDLKDLAKENRKAVGTANTANLGFANHLLDISHPDMSGADLGNLLFSQGEQEAHRQHDSDLATILRQNLRSGSPLSSADILGGMDRQNQNQWADRRSSSTLQGLLGVLPSAAAIQTAGGLGRQVPATLDPSIMAQSIGLRDNAFSHFLAAATPSLGQLFGGGSQPQQPGLGNTGNIQQSGDIMAAYGTGGGSTSMLSQLLPFLM